MDILNIPVRLVYESLNEQNSSSAQTGDCSLIIFAILFAILIFGTFVFLAENNWKKIHFTNIKGYNILTNVFSKISFKFCLLICVIAILSSCLFSFGQNAAYANDNVIVTDKNEIIATVHNDGSIELDQLTLSNISNDIYVGRYLSLALSEDASQNEFLKNSQFSMCNNGNLIFQSVPDSCDYPPITSFEVQPGGNSIFSFALSNIDAENIRCLNDSHIFTMSIKLQDIKDLCSISTTVNHDERGTVNYKNFYVSKGSTYKVFANTITFCETNDEIMLEAIPNSDYVFNNWALINGTSETDLVDEYIGTVDNDINFVAKLGMHSLKYLGRTYLPVIPTGILPEGVRFFDENENELFYDGNLSSLKGVTYYMGSGFYGLFMRSCGWDFMYKPISEGTSVLRDDYRTKLSLVDDEEVAEIHYIDDKIQPVTNIEGVEYPVQEWYSAFQQLVFGGIWAAEAYMDHYARYWDVWGKCWNGADITLKTENALLSRKFENCTIATSANDDAMGMVEQINFDSNNGTVYKVTDEDASVLRLGDRAFFVKAKSGYRFSHWEKVYRGESTSLSAGDNGLIFSSAQFVAVFEPL